MLLLFFQEMAEATQAQDAFQEVIYPSSPLSNESVKDDIDSLPVTQIQEVGRDKHRATPTGIYRLKYLRIVAF